MLLFPLAAWCGVAVFGQASTDACGFTAGAKWTVGASCNPVNFAKPAGYNANMNPAGCNAGNYDDAFGWFAGTGNPVIVTYTPPGGGDAVLHVLSGTCAAPVVVACSDNCCGGAVESVTIPTVLGTNYIVRVQRWGSNTAMDGTLCVYSAPPPPGCGQVFYDPGGAGGNYPNGSNAVTTICPTNPGDMVALNFTSFNTEDGYDELTIYDGNTTAAPLIGTYSGTTLPPVIMATNPGGCLTAAFNSDGSVTSSGWAATVSCITPPTGDCVYILNLHDSNGNGWGSSQVGVRINGGPYTYYTVTASNNFALIGVDLGDFIELNYVATGPNQGQNSYSISKLGQNPYFTSATPPVAGITFSQIVACGPPPALPQDCAGGFTVCTSQAITNNSSGTGDVMDLNTANRGCLNGENQGTWYYFSSQTAGTIGFTIAPANGTDDYDFAVWGPYTTAQCPTGPPLRCSWNAPPSYNVGLGNGATDVSEGAGGDGWVQTIAAQAGDIFVMYIDNYSTSGQAFTLNWQLSGGSSLDCTTLPVELLDLQATAHDPVIEVSWATATEQDSHLFTVERSPDNAAFTPIGTVPAAGNAQFRSDYLFVDEHPYRGVNYYRLEQVDINGTTMRSPTVVAVLSDAGGRPSVYPNPVSDVLNVEFTTPLDGPAMLEVQDAVGRTMARSTVMATRGDQTAELFLTALARGWYSLRITLPGGMQLQGGGFIKQ